MTYHSPGALHIHSTFSDGAGDLDEIVRDARAAGLEWIGMTDHDTLEPAYRGFEGIHDGLAVIVGYEWTPDGDHMLVYGDEAALGSRPLDRSTPPAEAIRIFARDGALAHVAHPDERRGTALRRLEPYPWHDWSVRGMQGIELWNYMSEWAERLTKWNAILHVVRPASGMQGPTARTLAWWDALNVPLPGPGRFAGGDRLTVGVSGTDAHAFKIRIARRTLTIFPYLDLFRAFTNYLLLPGPLPPDIDGARAGILAAIGEGRLYFADRRYGEARGTELVVTNPDGQAAGMGGTLPWCGSADVRASVPLPADLRLVRDGTEVARSRGRSIAVTAEGPGAYRLEARRRGRAWAFTNPVVLAPER